MCSKRGSLATSASVMPWIAVASAGICMPGWSRRVRFSCGPSGRNFSTLISTMRSNLGLVPVVSRSMTASGLAREMFLSMGRWRRFENTRIVPGRAAKSEQEFAIAACEPACAARCPHFQPRPILRNIRSQQEPGAGGGTPMKRIFLIIILLAAVLGIAYVLYPEEVAHFLELTASLAAQAWEGVKANPLPAALGAGTFLLTIVYHKAKGKSLRESVEVAATRVAVVQMPAEALRGENPVIRRAKARATRTQLLADQIALENRQRKLPDEIVKAEKEAGYAEQAVVEARDKLAVKQKANDEAVAKLESLRDEQARAESELAEIEAELDKLAEPVSRGDIRAAPPGR